jgi:hypothetical protein
MMISRHWKGTAKPEEADAYVNHLVTETFPQLSSIDGFIRASILTRPVSQGVEFLIITIWESMESVQDFAGVTVEVAVVPAEVQAMMIAYDREVSHYAIKADYEPDRTHL